MEACIRFVSFIEEPPSVPVRSDPPSPWARARHHCIFHCIHGRRVRVCASHSRGWRPLHYYYLHLIRIAKRKDRRDRYGIPRASRGSAPKWLWKPFSSDRHEAQGRMEPMEPMEPHGTAAAPLEAYEYEYERKLCVYAYDTNQGTGNRPTTLSKRNLFFFWRAFIESTPNLIASPESTTYVHRKLREAEGKKKTTTGVKVKKKG